MTKMWREEFAISKERAKQMLDVTDDGMVHTFYNGSFGLIGADRSKESIFADIDDAHHCEETGGMAQKMGHGVAIFPHENCGQSDILFVATKSTENGERE